MRRENLVPGKGTGETEPWELGWGRDQKKFFFFSSKFDICMNVALLYLCLLPFIADGPLELFYGNWPPWVSWPHKPLYIVSERLKLLSVSYIWGNSKEIAKNIVKISLVIEFKHKHYSRLPITRTFKGNRNRSSYREFEANNRKYENKQVDGEGMRAIKRQSIQEWTLNLNWSEKIVKTKNLFWNKFNVSDFSTRFYPDNCRALITWFLLSG